LVGGRSEFAVSEAALYASWELSAAFFFASPVKNSVK
jgi:hypothetical protein